MKPFGEPIEPSLYEFAKQGGDAMNSRQYEEWFAQWDGSSQVGTSKPMSLNTRLRASLKHQELIEDAEQEHRQNVEALEVAHRAYDAAYEKAKESRGRLMELRRKAGL